MDITFGSGKLDLSNAIIDSDVTINLNIAFSGVKITLPQGCRLDIRSSTSFAGVENKYTSSSDPDARLVTVIANVSFGGVEIK